MNKNQQQQANLLESLSMCNIDTVRHSIFNKIEKLQLAYSELEKELSIEKLKNIELTENDIIFFLNRFKNENIDDVILDKISKSSKNLYSNSSVVPKSKCHFRHLLF